VWKATVTCFLYPGGRERVTAQQVIGTRSAACSPSTRIPHRPSLFEKISQGVGTEGGGVSQQLHPQPAVFLAAKGWPLHRPPGGGSGSSNQVPGGACGYRHPRRPAASLQPGHQQVPFATFIHNNQRNVCLLGFCCRGGGGQSTLFYPPLKKLMHFSPDTLTSCSFCSHHVNNIFSCCLSPSSLNLEVVDSAELSRRRKRNRR